MISNEPPASVLCKSQTEGWNFKKVFITEGFAVSLQADKPHVVVPHRALFLTFRDHCTTLAIQKVCEITVIINDSNSARRPLLECWKQALVCFQRGSGDWRRWWRMRYHESKVWHTEGQEKSILGLYASTDDWWPCAASNICTSWVTSVSYRSNRKSRQSVHGAETSG